MTRRYLPKPRGLWRLDKAYKPRWANLPETAVCVSLCGDLRVPWGGIVLEADPTVDYDWSRLAGWYVQVLVRPGIDATRTVRALLPVVMPYLMVIDVQEWKAWSIDSTTPRLRGWQEPMPRRNPTWI